MKPALGLLELVSVARGIRCTDLMLKRAPVELVESTSICAGKYMILIHGDEASVEESMAEGAECAGEYIVDRLFLPNVHRMVVPAIAGTAEVGVYEALGVIEGFSVAATVTASDRAAKAAEVRLLNTRLANGLGGKSYFSLTGSLDQVEAAVEAAKELLAGVGALLQAEVIPRPHPDMAGRVL